MFAIGGLFVLLLGTACSTSGTPAIQPSQNASPAVSGNVQSVVQPSQNTTQTITGTIHSVTAADAAGNFIVAVKSANGTNNVTVSKNTSIAVQGQACTLDEVNLYNLQGTSYNCTVVIDPCDGKATQFDVVKIYP